METWVLGVTMAKRSVPALLTHVYQDEYTALKKMPHIRYYEREERFSMGYKKIVYRSPATEKYYRNRRFNDPIVSVYRYDYRNFKK